MNAFQQLQGATTARLGELSAANGLWAERDIYAKRLEYELSVFHESGYSQVILIIRDYIRWARDNNIVVGPGRGSAAGSLVVYLAEITTLDPIRFGLLFERFLNPERVSLPDIDTDFSDRDAVIEYLRERYGRNRVVKVGAPSLFKPRSAIDEFARVLGVPFDETKRINKIINKPTFEECEAANPQFKEYERKHPELFALAKRSIGYVRYFTTHPSAVIVTTGPAGKHIPLQRPKGNSEDLVCQWDGEELDNLGYVKLDILTIDNLAIIRKTIDMLGEGDRPDFYNLPLQDGPTLDSFRAGHTAAVFQFEEQKTISILTNLSEVNFDNLCQVNAAIRPGLDVDEFIRNRNNPSDIDYPVHNLGPILDETYGVILYQEQVMRICVDIAGFSMPEADKVRKIIAKTSNQQDPIGLAKVYDKFADGYLANGHPQDKLAALWDKILACQRYVLCKSHATAYAYIAYANMYLKTHWPLQYMCAALQTKNRELFANECKRLNIPVLPPDVNKSKENFTIEGDGIRVGLSCIKNVGKSGKMIKGQPYNDEFDFVDRAKPRKKALQYLIYAGALDAFDERANLISVFCEGSRGTSVGDMASYEKEAIGYYVSMNPLEKYKDQLRDCITAEERPPKCKVGGMVMRVHVHQAKTGPMCFVSLLIEGGEIDALIWPSNFALEYPKLGVGNVITASAKVTDRGSFAIRDITVIGETDKQVAKADKVDGYTDIEF